MAVCERIVGRTGAARNLGRVLVLGLGRSGRAAVEYCLPLLGERVKSLCVAAGARTAESEEYAVHVAACGVETAFEDAAVVELAARVTGGRFDLCIPSPGIPPFSPLFKAAQALSAEVMSEVEFAWRESAASSRWVAVTGTNGKTTACACAAHVLSSAGLRARAVGNIGDACIGAVASGDVDVYVVETSSYQLASTQNFAPDVAVLLNITPDHLHWHGSFEAYRDAKRKVLANLSSRPGAVAVLDATNDVVRTEVRRLRALEADARAFSYVPLGTAEGLGGDMRRACGSDNAAFLDGEGVLRVALDGVEHVLLKADELLIRGEHNVSNALAAATAALALGVDADDVARGLRTFAPLEHRIEPCGDVRGVRFFNDSKATNVDATLKALSSFPGTRLVVLLGGDDKGTDLAPLVAAARDSVHAVVCYGAAGRRFAEAFEKAPAGGPVVLRAAHLKDAFQVALDTAEPGDAVLLSPACASFDEFSSFEERGRVFKALVADRAARGE